MHQKLAAREIADFMAAFRLVHVMRADQHGHPAGGETVDLVPELAPRFGIDARGGLVEQEQPRRVQHAGGKREALLPAAGQLARELTGALSEAKPLERLADRPSGFRHAVQAGDEV